MEIMDLAVPLERRAARRLRMLARAHGVRPVAALLGVSRHAVAVAAAALPLSREQREHIEHRLADLEPDGDGR